MVGWCWLSVLPCCEKAHDPLEDSRVNIYQDQVGGTWLWLLLTSLPLTIHCSGSEQAQTSFFLSFLVVCALPTDASPSSASAALGPSAAQHASAREAGQGPQPRAGA